MANNEQAISIAQVSEGVEQISTIVQTNAITAEQSAATSEELSSQSNILKELIEKQQKPLPPRNKIGFKNYD